MCTLILMGLYLSHGRQFICRPIPQTWQWEVIDPATGAQTLYVLP